MASEHRTILPNIPQEIITEILLRLPVKSLVKFRCVSKSWLFLISSSQFAKTHLKISSKKNKHDSLVFGCSKIRVTLRSCYLDSFLLEMKSVNASELDGLKMLDSLWIIGSSNGLICISGRKCGIFLWNPSIRKSKELPPSGSESGQFGFSCTYGFGYDELNDDYKVVGTYGYVDNDFKYLAQVKIYSLRTNSWTKIENWPGAFVAGNTSVFVNGAFHWLTLSAGGNSPWHINSLNLATEMYGEVSMPKKDININGLSLGILRDCLCVFNNYNTHLDVWMMKEYGIGESWTKLVCIMGIQNYKYETPMPVYVSESGIVVMNYGSTLKLYNSSDNTSNGQEICPYNPMFEHKAITYIESLILPNSDHEGNQHWWQWGTKDDHWDFQHIGLHGDLVDSALQQG